VLVQRIKAEAKTASGIYLPESSVKELNEAKVLAVGPGGLDKDGKRMPMGVSAGDRVLIPQVRTVTVGFVEPVLGREEEIWLTRDAWVTVRRFPGQGWRGGVPSLPGQRVSRHVHVDVDLWLWC
jgi:chaperonin GroES